MGTITVENLHRYYSADSDKRLILFVTLAYLKELHDVHDACLLRLEKMVVDYNELSPYSKEIADKIS